MGFLVYNENRSLTTDAWQVATPKHTFKEYSSNNPNNKVG